VTHIATGAFDSCSNLENIKVDNGNTIYRSVDGVLFYSEVYDVLFKTTLHTYPAGKQSASYSIPKSVTSIGCNAFYGCTGLKSVTIPINVNSIEMDAFFGCSGLTSVILLNSIPPELMTEKMDYGDSIGPFPSEITAKACLYVPSSSIDAYRSTDGWSAFKCIKSTASR